MWSACSFVLSSYFSLLFDLACGAGAHSEVVMWRREWNKPEAGNGRATWEIILLSDQKGHTRGLITSEQRRSSQGDTEPRRSPQPCRYEKTIQSRRTGGKHPLVCCLIAAPRPQFFRNKIKTVKKTNTVVAEECSLSPRGLLVLCKPCAFKRLMNTAVR